MKVKIIEIRDEATSIAALCVDMNPDNDVQRWYLRRYGFSCDGRPNVAITRVNLGGGDITNDPYGWSGLTWRTINHYIIEHWDELEDGSVVDVRVILGEAAEPAESERLARRLS